jgi:serine/threonine-protein kinase
MGAVFAATQDDLGRRVAIKVLHPHLAERHDLLERFKREAMAAAALGHPNVVQVTDFCQVPGEPPFLVMEQLSGETLRDCIDREGRLPPGRVAFIAAQVLSALETTHAAGIVHRDLKPENVFLTAITGVRDIVKVLDFGLAKHDVGGPALTDTGQVMGTPAYMAPEQVSGQPVTAATDLYALGALMFVALTGHTPFSGDNNYALMYAIAQGQRPNIASLRPDLDPGLASAIERAMAVDPRQRFSSATEMRRAIEPFAQGERPPASVVMPGPGLAPALAPPTQPSGFGSAHPTPGSPAEAPTIPGSLPNHASVPAVPAPNVSYGPGPAASATAPVARNNTLLIVVIVGIVVLLLAVLGLGAAIVLTRGTDSANAVTPEQVAQVDAANPVAGVKHPDPPAPTPTTPPPSPMSDDPAPSPSDADADADADADRPGVLTRLGLRGGNDAEENTPAEPDDPPSPPDEAEDKVDADSKAKKQTTKKKKKKKVPTGGTKPRLAFINAHALLDLKVIKAQFATIQDPVTACYVKHEFSPGDHVHSSYHLFIDGAGKTTKATKMGNRERSPDLDQCLFPLLRKLDFGPPKIEGGGKIDITYTAWIPGQ